MGRIDSLPSSAVKRRDVSTIAEAFTRKERGLRTVCFNVSCHAVDNVRNGNTRVRLVGVVVDDGRSVDCPIAGDWPKALVPVDVAGDVQIHAVLKPEILECCAHVGLVGRVSGRVHGTVGACNYPWGLCAVDGGKIGLHPLILLVSGIVEGVVAPAFDKTEWAGVVCERL